MRKRNLILILQNQFCNQICNKKQFLYLNFMKNNKANYFLTYFVFFVILFQGYIAGYNPNTLDTRFKSIG